MKDISLYKESKSANSNYWLQTLVLNKKNIDLKNKIENKIPGYTARLR